MVKRQFFFKGHGHSEQGTPHIIKGNCFYLVLINSGRSWDEATACEDRECTDSIAFLAEVSVQVIWWNCSTVTAIITAIRHTAPL